MNKKLWNITGILLIFLMIPKNFIQLKIQISNYFAMLAIGKYGKKIKVAELMKGWKHSLDSLCQWNISEKRLSLQTEWVFSKYDDQSAKTKALEKGILGAGKDRQIEFFLRPLNWLKIKENLMIK